MATTKSKTPAAGPATKGLRIVSRPDSFWRAGLQFTSSPRTISYDSLTTDQVDELLAEPLLVAVEVDIEPAVAA